MTLLSFKQCLTLTKHKPSAHPDSVFRFDKSQLRLFIARGGRPMRKDNERFPPDAKYGILLQSGVSSTEIDLEPKATEMDPCADPPSL